MQEPIAFVQPNEINVPGLNLVSRSLLLTVLNTVISGAGTVFCAVTYDKQTECPPRKENEDYVPMPGVSSKAQFGEITSVFRTKVGNHVRFRIASASRGNGVEPTGFTTLIPDGLTSFVVTGLRPAQGTPARPQQPQTQ